jgi:osmoprotectant transport system permease protein
VRSISLKISGQELHLELVELRDTVDKDIKGVETRIANQVSTAEQALWPMLAGDDPTCEQRWSERTIIIGSKLDPSQAFFAHFLAVWLERKVPGLRCIARVPNGGSLKNFADLKHGWIDAYIEYTGAASQYFNIDHRGRTPQQILTELNDYGARIGVRFGKRVGASENYALAVTTRLAEEEGLRTIRDLSRVSGRLVFTADPEFLNRRDCYIGLRNTYDLEFRRVEPCRVTQRYALMENGQADVFVAYETDPELQSPALRVLMDSEGFFPDYHAVPAVSMRAAERVPGLDDALDQLGDIMTTPDLVRIVHKLGHRGLHAAVVREIADQYVREKAAASTDRR